ncbi:MAG: hypothetical protein KF819_38470 [Labilithrix sp.]|nr:hypothetical protein [Labilithrix sp.]
MTLIPLAPSEIRARRRPGAILMVFLWELGWGFLIASAVHAWARRVWGADVEGDAALWRPGGRDLLAWLDLDDPALAVSARMLFLLLFVSAVASQLPLGALLTSLAFEREDARPPRARAAMRAGVSAFMPLAGLLVLGALAQILVVVAGVMISSGVDHGLAEKIGDARSFVLRVVTFALFAAIACVIGVFVDLARAAVGREAGGGGDAPGWTTMLRGIRAAMDASRGRLSRATIAWAWRAALGVLLVGLGAIAASALGGKGGAALVALFVIHQLVVLGRVALRASWLARALGMVIEAPRAIATEAPAEIAPAEDAQREAESER